MSLEKKQVIIIGAGISAIGAARTLINAGIEPIILEGRERIGGRLFPHSLTRNLQSEHPADHDGVEPSVTIQLGANWIHGLDERINPMFRVAQRLGLKLHQTSPDDSPGDDVLLFDCCDQCDGHCDGCCESMGTPIPSHCCS